MKAREIEIFMRENGFRVERTNKLKTFWTDGTSRIVTHAHGMGDPKAEANLRAEVKRALQVRPVITKSVESIGTGILQACLWCRKDFKAPHVTGVCQQCEAQQREKEEDRKLIQAQETNQPTRRIVRPELKAPLLEFVRNPGTQPAVKREPEPKKEERPLSSWGSPMYTKDEKELIMLKIKELFLAGLSYARIAQEMTNYGFRTTAGNPFEVDTVYYFTTKLGLRRNQQRVAPKKAAIAAPVAPPPTAMAPPIAAPKQEPDPAAPMSYADPPSIDKIKAILQDQNISPEKRIKIALAYLE